MRYLLQLPPKQEPLTLQCLLLQKQKPPRAFFPSFLVLFSLIQQLRPRILIAVKGSQKEATRLTLLQFSFQARMCSSYRRVMQRKHVKPSPSPQGFSSDKLLKSDVPRRGYLNPKHMREGEYIGETSFPSLSHLKMQVGLGITCMPCLMESK